MYATDYPQVVTLDVSGDRSSAKWLGQQGNVSALNYEYTTAGGASAMSLNLARHATYRTNAMNPGRQVKIICGGSIIWDGTLNEPDPSDSGWTITARGSGTFGDDYMAVFDDWRTNPDESINRAITRGMRWTNAGIGRPAGIWLGQAADPASMTITEMLDLVCTRGGLTWTVNPRQSRNGLDVFALPTDPTRILISDTPVARTVGGAVNTLWIRYKTLGVPPSQNTPIRKLVLFNTTTVVRNNASIAVHGPLESFIDLSSAGTQPPKTQFGVTLPGGWMTRDDAQTLGNYILSRYKRISYAGPFVIGPGQLTNPGGRPVDLACEPANRLVCKLMLTDFGYGGEVSPLPPQILVGKYNYDVDSLTATITPHDSIRNSFADLLSEIGTTYHHGIGDWKKR